MGTNYYYRHNICECCGRFDELHIGKSSGGWCFALHVLSKEEMLGQKVDNEKFLTFHFPNGLQKLSDWEKLFNFKFGDIVDEYGNFYDHKDMLNIITKRNWVDKSIRSSIDWEVFHKQNYSETGTNGLVRHKIQGSCIGHGEGTWDYIVGDFS